MPKNSKEMDDLGFGDWFQDESAEDTSAAEAKAREEAERKAREEAERKAREEADRKAREEAERKAREEAERKAREEADRKAREEAERKAREEAERKAREEAERKAREEAERKAREEAERKAREEAERKAREEADRKAREEADRKAREEAAALEDSWFSGDDADQAVASVSGPPPVSGPTIVAPEEEPSAPVQIAAPEPEPEPAPEPPPATLEVEVEAPSQEVAESSEVSVVDEEEEDFEATADSFIDGAPDQTMVMRRENPEVAAEIAAALADRDSRKGSRVQDVVIPRSSDAAPPPPVVPPPIPVPAPILPVALQAPPAEPAGPPPEVAGAWSEDANLLEREAAVATDAASQSALLAEAGRIHAARLGNMDVAERLLSMAIQTGSRDAELLKLYGATVAAREDLVLLRQVLERRANASSGVVAAEALQDAALLERNMRQDAGAVALLERALELAPDDWFTLRLLRELHYRARNWEGLCLVLTSMAGLASGPRASRYLVEQGRILEEQLTRPDQARASYDLALDADPTYAPALLAAERLAHAAGDLARLADLYETQARLSTEADSAFWWARSARFALRAGLDDARVTAAYDAALAASGEDAFELRHEHQHFLASRGRWADLAASLSAEAGLLGGAEAAPVLIRLGAVYADRLSDADAAISAWRAALEADPTADPALESLVVALSGAGRHEELLALFDEHAGRVEDQNLSVSLLVRAGELCEGPIGDLPAASARYRRILETSAGYLPALEGLERVAERMSDWQTLVSLAEQRAMLSEESSVVSLHLFRAGVVCELRLGDRERARSFYQRSLMSQGRYVAALDAYTRLLESEGNWETLADTLGDAALSSEDGNEVVSLTYRAGRLYAERVGNVDKAISALRRCLELSPGFLPAMALLRELCLKGQLWQEAYDLYRQEAEAVENPSRRHWRMLGAAEVARHLSDLDPATVAQEILNEDPNNLAAMSLLEQRALETGDTAGLVAVYRRRAAATKDPSVRARLIARVADLARDAGDAVSAIQAITEVIEIDCAGRPLFALARVAEGVHYWDEAQRALRAGGEQSHLVELARLQETYVPDAAAAAAAWRRVLEQEPTNTEAAAGVERTVTRGGGREGLAEAHAILADHLPDPAIRTVHALLAGHLFEAAGDRDNAVRYFRVAFEARPAQGKAFDALRRLYIAGGDADGVESLFGALSESAPLDLALALEEAGAIDRAARIYQAEIGTLLADEPLMLPLQVRLSAALSATEQWQQVFETLGQELACLRDPENRRHVEARRRRILAEKLAETEQAWEFYRQLHEESPGDREILEALARIAHARGETDLALTYLDGLSRVTQSREEAARYQRRIADIHRSRGDDEGARQAFLRALDFQPEDLEALAGLRSLAQNQGNWQALVGVLAREATMLSGDERLGRYREIARIWEEEIKERAVAVDAWRKVLEAAPGDLEALQHMVALTRALEDHAAFVDVARALAGQLEGEERARLRTEIGRICLEHLYNEGEAVVQLEAAAADGSLEAAQILERVFAGRGDWERSVAAILRQAELAPDEAVSLMLRAAQVRQEMLHDADGVDGIYQAVLARDPDNAEALRFRGAWLYKKNELSGAVDVWRRLETSELGRDLDDFDVRMEVSLYFFRFAEAERQLGQLEDALTHYRRALELNPSHLPSLEAVGPVYVQLGRWEQAGETYRSILQLTGGQGDMDRIASTYVSLGLVDQHLGDLEKAKKRFSKALEIRPNHVGALLGTASVLFARGEWNNLLNIYNNIIYHAQEPSRVIEAYLAKGYVLDAKMNLPDKAAQHYQKSLDYDPAQPTALLRLAEISLRKKDYPQAGALADRGLGLTLSDGRLRAALLLVRAAALAGTGQGELAAASYGSAIESDASWMGLGERMPAPDALSRALKERLQASL